MKQTFKKSPSIEGTVYKWSNSLGIDRKTLTQSLSRSGRHVADSEKISARDVFKAITGDKEAAMTRKLLAEAEEKERNNRIAEGEIVTVEEAAQMYSGKIAALVQKMDSIPAIVPGLSLEQRQVLMREIEDCKQMGRAAQ
jgi:hypothetical protein